MSGRFSSDISNGLFIVVLAIVVMVSTLVIGLDLAEVRYTRMTLDEIDYFGQDGDRVLVEFSHIEVCSDNPYLLGEITVDFRGVSNRDDIREREYLTDIEVKGHLKDGKIIATSVRRGHRESR